jgi:preflagellin peptidase FlaK
MQLSVVDLARLSVTTVLLSYSSWSDYRRREVEDWVWGVFLIAAVCLDAGQVMDPNADLVGLGASVVLQCSLFVGLYWLGVFGGADAKSLICLSVMFPTLPLGVPMLAGPDIALVLPLSTFVNAVLLSLSYVLLNLAQNIRLIAKGRNWTKDDDGVSPLKSIASFVVLRKMKLSEFIRSRHAFQFATFRLQDARLSSIIQGADRLPAWEGYSLDDDRFVFVQPLIPLQVFVLAGFVTSYLVGTLPFYALNALPKVV